MQPSDRVNIYWIPDPVLNNKYEATWSNSEKTYTITVGIPNGLSHEYVKNIIEEKFKEFKVNDMDMLAKNKFRYDPLKNDRESQTFSDISSAAEVTLKRAELRGWITGMISPKDESDLMIEAVVVPRLQKKRSLTSETSHRAGRSSFVSRASPESSISRSPEFNKALFDRFPDEMIVSMLMKLSVKEIVRMREVDTRFRDLGGDALVEKICNENVSLVEFGLRGNAKILAFLDSLSPVNRHRIRQLNLSGTEIDNRFLARFSSLTPNLQDLNLEGCSQITNDGLQHLAPLTQSRSISLAWCSEITNDGLQHLAPLTQLRSISLEGCSRITNDGLQHLVPLTELRSLNGARCSQISNDGLQHLTLLTELRDLNFTWCSQISNDGLKYLAPLTELRDLNLAGCFQITNEGLQHLAPLTELRNLNLAGCSITNDGLQQLAPLTQLRSLNLEYCRDITDDGLQQLAPFKKLENLSLAWCSQITNDGLQYLAPLTELRSLNFAMCSQITNYGLKHLAPLKKLENLSLVWCLQITDDGLQHLATLTQLRSLNLRSCDITDRGIQHLFPLTQLQKLSIAQCNKITDAGRNALKRHIPGLKFY